MKHFGVFGFLFLLCALALVACNGGRKTDVKTTVKDSLVIVNPIKDTIEEVKDGCTGARPDKPIVDSIKYPHRQFRFQNRIGYNDFVTNKGDSITIEQSNCDYASYTFVIRSHRNELSGDTTVWISKAADIIEALKSDIDMAVDMDSGLLYLRKFYAEKNKSVGEEIHFNDRPQDQWRNVVIVNSAIRSKDMCILTITFYEGPL